MNEGKADESIAEHSDPTSAQVNSKKSSVRTVARREPIVIGGKRIEPGQRCYVDLPLLLYEAGVVLGYISDSFGEAEQAVVSNISGVLIGITKLPLVHEGEALYHTATTESTKSAVRALDDFHLEYEQPVIKRLK